MCVRKYRENNYSEHSQGLKVDEKRKKERRLRN